MSCHTHEYSEADVSSKGVIICRFGSAYGTLTVLLLDKEIHLKVQDELDKLDKERKLEAPKFVLSEKVCFKSNDGFWTRAFIGGIHETATADSVIVDITNEETGENHRRVSGEALVAMPASVAQLPKASLYFIEGLEPYKTVVSPTNDACSIGAQKSADALNEVWKLVPDGTTLIRSYYLPPENPARRSGIAVARVFLTRALDLRSYITSILSHHQITTSSQFIKRLWKRAQHPNPGHKIAGPWFLRPYVTEREVCEVISIRKKDDDKLQVGLCLSTYVDMDLLNRLLKFRGKIYEYNLTGERVAISISENGIFKQRGVVVEKDNFLGLDSLEMFNLDSKCEFRPLPRFMADVLPHIGLFIEWDASANPRIPCIGETIAVTNLEAVSGKLLYYTFSEVTFLDEPTTVINYHPARPQKSESPVLEDGAGLRSSMEENRNPIRKKTRAPRTLADWYSLNDVLKARFENLEFFNLDPPLESSLVQHGETLRIQDL